MSQPTIAPMGDTGLIVSWHGLTDHNVLKHTQAFSAAIGGETLKGVVGVVPAFASVTVHYDPCRLTLSEIETAVRKILSRIDVAHPCAGRLIKIPVCYDPEFAWDLLEISESLRLSPREIIRLHCQSEYVVQMVGFAPGFPYLSGLPSELCLSRRATPRLEVPAGSVAIGGKQTGIYSLTTPGGWQIIGRTPVRLFLPQSDPPCLLQAGDRVRFDAIGIEEFLAWRTET